MSSEQLYIHAFSQGDPSAFEVLFVRYQPGLVKFICSFIKDEDDARDLSQDVFLRLWSNRAECGELRSFKAYLFKTAKFAIYDYFDRMLVSSKYMEHQLRQEVPAESAEESLFARQLHEAIMRVLDTMPPARRQIFSLSREHGYSNQEIAQQLNISKRTVENQITTALSQIRRSIRTDITILLLITLHSIRAEWIA